MNYLEAEIDEAVIALKIAHKKLTAEDLKKLLSALTKKFFKFEKTLLDPMEFNNISSEHNPNFWREITDRIKKQIRHYWSSTLTIEHGKSTTRRILQIF